MRIDYQKEYKVLTSRYQTCQDISELVFYRLGPLLDDAESRYLLSVGFGALFEELLECFDSYSEEVAFVKSDLKLMVDYILDDKYSQILHAKWKRYLGIRSKASVYR